MNLKDTANKDSLLKRKDYTLKRLDSFMLKGINSDAEAEYKKAANLVYWVCDYIKYIEQKEFFEPKKMIKYQRGQIIKVNLGFNVGREEGGLRYAIILDKNNSQASDVVTIIPLTSVKFNKDNKIKNLHGKYDVLLGEHLFDVVLEKHNEYYNDTKGILESMQLDIVEARKMRDTYFKSIGEKIKRKHIYTTYKNNFDGVSFNLKNMNKNSKVQLLLRIEHLVGSKELRIRYKNIMSKLLETKQTCDDNMVLLKKTTEELKKMNKGTIALAGQITTVSKQRIYYPKYLGDVLANLRLPKESMELIAKKIKELYVF